MTFDISEVLPLVQGLPTLARQRRAIMVVDLVESVRLLLDNEADAVHRWRVFLNKAHSILLRTGGRAVKSLGDGLLAEFEYVPPAVAASAAMHAEIAELNSGHPVAGMMSLRIAVHIAEVFIDTIDVYGAGVNLAARLASLARPGETILSADARDAIVDGLHGDLEDLGDCYLKHIGDPIRAFRLHPCDAKPAAPWPAAGGHQAVLAVVPFALVASDREMTVIGEALAEDIIGALSRLPSLQLISRLSTSPLRDSIDPVGDSRRLLRAHYALTGHYSLQGERVTARCSLSEAAEGEVLFHDVYEASIDELFAPDGGFIPNLVAQVGHTIVRREVKRTRAMPLPTLENYALFIGGISLMHRMSERDFQHAKVLFEHLEHRLPRNPVPKAMLAKWHLMRQLQGWSRPSIQDSHLARDFARRALDQDPEQGFALATEAFVSAHTDGDLRHAREGCRRALDIDPHEAQCWRMAAGVHSYLGEGAEAEVCAERAIALTPLDPTRFIFEVVLGAAKLASGKYAEALALAESSLRRNAMHVPTHRLRVLALSMWGRDDDARGAARDMLALSPGFRVDDFARGYPGRDQPHAEHYFGALRRAGIPG